ncbi:MAG: MerR family transcriptional regulator [Rhodospirillales bacterium]
MAILDHDVGTTSPQGASARLTGKSDKAFRTIAEVALDLELPAHVLRFWESKFPQVKPLKRRGGRRYYRPEDVDLLRHIRTLLYTDGYTIRGVQKLLKESGTKSGPVLGGDRDEAPAGDPDEMDLEPVDGAEADGSCTEDSLAEVLNELEAIRALLRVNGF